MLAWYLQPTPISLFCGHRARQNFCWAKDTTLKTVGDHHGPNLTLWWTFFLIALFLDVVLWASGFLLDIGPDGRFRLLISAGLLLYVVLGMVLGWGIATAIWFAGLWIYAIIPGW